MARKYEVYVCPGCGDELSVYDIEPFSVTDVGADRREGTGNYFCSECNRDYEHVTAIDERDVEPLVAAVKDTLCDEPLCSRCEFLRGPLKAFEAEEDSE